MLITCAFLLALENDLRKVEISWIFILCFYHKIHHFYYLLHFFEQHQILLRESLWNVDKTTQLQIFFVNSFTIFGDELLAVPNLAIINKRARWMESVTDNGDNFKLRELNYS